MDDKQQIAELERLLKARRNQPGYAQNVADIEAKIAALKVPKEESKDQ